jgi:hypothetical protein
MVDLSRNLIQNEGCDEEGDSMEEKRGYSKRN